MENFPDTHWKCGLKLIYCCPGQITEDTAKYDTWSGKVRKRKAKEGLKLYSKEEEGSFGVWPSDLPGGSQSNGETGGPSGGEGLQGVTDNQVLPEMSHVADGPSSATGAFWSLLERAGYTVWWVTWLWTEGRGRLEQTGGRALRVVPTSWDQLITHVIKGLEPS